MGIHLSRLFPSKEDYKDVMKINAESQDGQVLSDHIDVSGDLKVSPEPKDKAEDEKVHPESNIKLEDEHVLMNKNVQVHLDLKDKLEKVKVQPISSENPSLELKAFEHRGVDLVSLESAEKFESLYEIQKQVGDGTFSIVYLITHQKSKETKAAKVMKYRNKSEYNGILKEIHILNCFDHPNLPQLSSAYIMPDKIATIMEYMSGGELTERVTSCEEDAAIYLRQMCDGLSYMHSKKIVHLDLKPENVMFLSRTSKTIKIIDFGLAKILSSNVGLRPEWGASEFMPPEWNENFDTPLGPEADVWGAGVLCFMLLSGCTPFTGKNHKETRVNIVQVTYSFSNGIFDFITNDAKDFINSILVKRKEERPTASQCLQHKWLKCLGA